MTLISINRCLYSARSVRFLMIASWLLLPAIGSAQDRSGDGLLVLYDFTEGSGQTS